MAMCDAKDDLMEGSCAGLGCCQTSIPKDVLKVTIDQNYLNVPKFSNCNYAFVVEESSFRFSHLIL